MFRPKPSRESALWKLMRLFAGSLTGIAACTLVAGYAHAWEILTPVSVDCHERLVLQAAQRVTPSGESLEIIIDLYVYGNRSLPCFRTGRVSEREPRKRR